MEIQSLSQETPLANEGDRHMHTVKYKRVKD